MNHAILHLLNSQNWNSYSVTLAKNTDVNTAITYQALLRMSDSWEEKERLDDDGYFYATYPTLEHWTALSKYQLMKCVSSLEELGLILHKINGMPAKNWFKILNTEVAINTLVALLSLSSTSSKETTPQVVKKLNYKEDRNLTTSSKETTPQVVKKTRISSKDIAESNNTNNKSSYTGKQGTLFDTNLVPKVIDYLNKEANKNFTYDRKDTINMIKSLTAKGYTLADIKHVIDVKVASWKGTDMETYIRPKTLFGSKFEDYVNEKVIVRQSKVQKMEGISAEGLAKARRAQENSDGEEFTI